jgi:hypothetical protein
MRFLIRTRIPAEAGNKLVHDPDFLKKLEEYINRIKPEASYFMPIDGQRSMAFIVDIERNDQIPTIAEQLFQWGATVDVIPVMNFDDLKRGLQNK